MILFFFGNCSHATPYLMGGPPPFISTFNIYVVSWEDVDHFVHVTLEVITTAFWLLIIFSQVYLVCFLSLTSRNWSHWFTEKCLNFLKENVGVILEEVCLFMHCSYLSMNVLLSIKFMYSKIFLRRSFSWM